jgi:hypothetical protein
MVHESRNFHFFIEVNYFSQVRERYTPKGYKRIASGQRPWKYCIVFPSPEGAEECSWIDFFVFYRNQGRCPLAIFYYPVGV